MQEAHARRQVMVGNRRVRTIDTHAHCVMPAGVEVAKAGGVEEANGPFPRGSLGINPDQRIRDMDAQGIDVQVLSVIPYFWFEAERDLAAEIVKANNEQLAEMCDAHSDRLVGLASVAMQHPDLAAAQLEEGIKRLGLRGAAIGANVAGEELADPRFDPFWAKAEELGAFIFIHPSSIRNLERGGSGDKSSLATRLQGGGWLTNVIGNPLDTTIAIAHLIFEGTLDRFPGLKLCWAHGGGFLPSYAARFDHGVRVNNANRPESAANTLQLKKRPSEYLRDLYFDSLVFTSEGLRHLAAEVGTSQIVIGTDYPIPWQPDSVDHILDTPDLTDDERIAMLGGTAAQLLGIEG